jgi:hypothetical protein
VQTFLPFADFVESALVLDSRRLGKQRVEALQIIRALTRETYGWKHHPVVKMWAGHEEALAAYALAMCEEWGRRGFADTVADTVRNDVRVAGVDLIRSQPELARAGLLPPWLGDDTLHLSHRAALVRKEPTHYRPLFDDVVDDQIPYVWPGRNAPVGAAGAIDTSIHA